MIYFLRIFFIIPILFARSDTNVDIVRGQIEPILLALSVIGDHNKDLEKVIHNDLKFSNFFSLVNKDAFVQNLSDKKTMINFSDWKVMHTKAITRVFSSINNNVLSVELHIYDVIQAKQIAHMSIKGNLSDSRKIAHAIADAIYKKLTGAKEGYFNSKIFFIALTGNHHNPTTRLAVMDYDGENLQYLTDGKDSICVPALSMDGKKLALVYSREDDQKIHIYDVSTGNHHPIISPPGLTANPAYSPDNRHLAFCYSDGLHSGIRIVDLYSGKMSILTGANGVIDSSPSFSSDSQYIFFESDRSGSQQIYKLNVATKAVERITLGNGKYANPMCSPDGQWIAFVKRQDGKFYVGIMKSNGNGERLLDSGPMLDLPTWSPDSRRIMYVSQSFGDKRGRGRSMILRSVDITGISKLTHGTHGNAINPVWSR